MTPTNRLKSLVRWRAGLAIAAVVLPLALFTLFERQARRLDTLAAEGLPVEAIVTSISRDGGSTSYAYRVDGAEHTWNVAREKARYAIGEAFTATYLPSDPSFSRPLSERGLATREAARNRSFSWKVVLGLALVLGFLVSHDEAVLSRAMIDHTGLSVRAPAKSRPFYEAALAPLGYQVLIEIPTEHTGGKVVFGMGVPPKPDFWIAEGTPNVPPLHIAFRAANRAVVDAFYKAALAAGGKDNGPPGVRAHYHPNYYGAFVLDLDGHNVEACCHDPE